VRLMYALLELERPRREHPFTGSEGPRRPGTSAAPRRAR
jgi:hypothetical protein